MTFTPAQLQAALAIEGDYSLITGAASFTDVTNYAGLGIATPDTVKILLYIQDATTGEFYKNAGYDTADFSAPDLEPINSDATYSFTLPTTATGAYMTGQYTINMKVQVVQDETVTVFQALYQNITATCNGITVVVAPNVTYNTAIVSVTDNTQYKAYTALDANIKLYPPQDVLGTQAMQQLDYTGTPATLIYEPPTGQTPYTGVWKWVLSSEVTYTDQETGASTTCLIASSGTFDVVQSQLCVVYCLLKKYRNEVLTMVANKQTYAELAEKNLAKAEGEYLLAWAASMCGKPQSEIDVYIDRILVLINKSLDCDCGCGDGTSQPLVPTSSINGTDGTDGSQILYGSGAPSGGTGAVGDTYINTVNGFMYSKTGASTWTYKLTIIGAAGTTPISVLHNDITESETTTTNWETFDGAGTIKSYTLPVSQMSADGDMIHLRTRIRTYGVRQGQAWKVTFDGNIISTGNFPNGTNLHVDVDIYLSRTSSAIAKIESYAFLSYSVFLSTIYGASGRFLSPITSIGGLDWTTTKAILVQGDSVVAGDLVCELLQVTYYKKS